MFLTSSNEIPPPLLLRSNVLKTRLPYCVVVVVNQLTFQRELNRL